MTAIRIAERLDSSETAQVLDLIGAVTEADSVAPLSEHVLLHLRHGGDEGGRHLIATDTNGVMIGYAHLDMTDEVHGASAELAVHLDHRRCGIGRRRSDGYFQT